MIGYKLVQDITVSTATTSVTFSGLNITSGDDYLLVSDIYNPSSESWMYIFVNGNTTVTNYYGQYLFPTGTTVYAGRGNNSVFTSVKSKAKNIYNSHIRLTNAGYFCESNTGTRQYGGSPDGTDKQVTTGTFTASSITSITIQAQYTNCIGAGSRFRLYQLTAQKVADVTIGTATTQVDFTGLSFDKSSEYLLISDIYNSSASSAVYNLTANGNTTLTNYYAQHILADSSTMTADRVNAPVLHSIGSTATGIQRASIKLMNSGCFSYQAYNALRCGTSTIAIDVYSGISTFTATSITSMSVIASAASAIGVGSRFQLYKLI